MKKLFILILTILMILSFGAFVACDKPEEETPTEPTISKVLINGFNEYDDIAQTYLNPVTFYGTFTRNKDPQYIVEGKASYKYWVKQVGVTQPNFNMKAAGVKTDVTDVVEFGFYIYSSADYEFSVILSLQDATETAVYNNTQKVVHGVNNIVFPVNRALLQDVGTAISFYDISFSGLGKQGETVLYFDNFYCMVTTEEVTVKPEVQTVINEIINLKATDRSAVEATYAKYKALSVDDRKAVYNFKILRTMMGQWWSLDIDNAKKDRPETLLFFDKPYGEGQVKEVDIGVESYEWTDKFSKLPEEGSLKVTFKASAATWNGITFSQLTPGDEGDMIEFYIYNDSDQRKGFKVDWTYPASGFITLAANEWTKIVCEARHLTDRSIIVFTGLTPQTLAAAPEGNLYFSSVKRFNINDQFEEARTGDDADTLLFYDRELGLNQINKGYNVSLDDISITDEVKMTGEDASMKIKVNTKTAKNKYVTLMHNGYKEAFNAGDMVSMYVYADVDVDSVVFRFSSSAPAYATRCTKKTWSRVLIPASEYLAKSDCFMIEYVNYDRTEEGFEGTIYLSRAKIIPASKIKDIEEVGVEYKIGNTEFVTSIEDDQLGSWAGGNGALYSMNSSNENTDIKSDVTPYSIDGVLRFYRTGRAAGAASGQPYITLTLKDSVTIKAGMKITLKIRGLANSPALGNKGQENEVKENVLAGFYLFGDTVQSVLPYIDKEQCERAAAEDGYETFTFTVPDVKYYTGEGSNAKSMRIYFGLGSYKKDYYDYYELIEIADVTIKNA